MTRRQQDIVTSLERIPILKKWEGQTTVNELDVTVTFGDPKDLDEVSRMILQIQDSFESLCLKVASDVVSELDDDFHDPTPEGVVKHLRLTGLSFFRDLRGVECWFDAGDLFGDHSVSIYIGADGTVGTAGVKG